MRCLHLPLVLGVMLAGFGLNRPALADDNPTLPGVKGDYRIVRPAPPEDDATPSATTNNTTPPQAGDWDITISGSVTVDVGVGDLPRRTDNSR